MDHPTHLSAAETGSFAGSGFAVELGRTAARVSLYGTDALMAVADAPAATVAILGRLTYRTELAARLGLSTFDNDADLALAAYLHGGAAALEQLEGDFAIVAVDRRSGTVEAVRDPMGGYPIYWTGTPDGIALATSPRLLPGAGEREVDPDFLAETMSLAAGEIDYFPATAFKGVSRLRGGERLSATAGATSPQVVRFWDWARQVERPASDRLDDIAAEYRDRLDAAVRERLRGRVAAHVSGGMDSSAVALLAARTLGQRGEKLVGISMVYDKIDNLRAEAPFIEHVLAAGPDIEPQRINVDDCLDFDGFQTCPPHDEPSSGLFRIALQQVGIDAATASGAQTLLTGLGADEVLSNAPFYIADLIRAGRVGEAYAEAGRWSRSRNCTIWRYLWPFGIAPLVPPALSSGWKSLLGGGFADWKSQSQTTIASFVERDFAAATGLHGRMLTHVSANFHSHSSVVLSEAMARLRATSGDWVRNSLARTHGLHISHPFRDPRVMRLGLGARLAVRPDPEQQKPVLSAAMAGVLPEPVLRRRSKTHFNTVYYKGLARNLPMLEALASDPANDPLGLFDREELRRCMHRVALGTVGVDAVTGLSNALSIMRWFSLLPAWRAAVPGPSRVIELPFAN
jgi:asparagine synthase (glutamine-hydrolysing)